MRLFHQQLPINADQWLTFTILAWTTKPIKQDVVYEDAQGVKAALEKLQKLPPLVTTQEVG